MKNIVCIDSLDGSGATYIVNKLIEKYDYKLLTPKLLGFEIKKTRQNDWSDKKKILNRFNELIDMSNHLMSQANIEARLGNKIVLEKGFSTIFCTFTFFLGNELIKSEESAKKYIRVKSESPLTTLVFYDFGVNRLDVINSRITLEQASFIDMTSIKKDYLEHWKYCYFKVFPKYKSIFSNFFFFDTSVEKGLRNEQLILSIEKTINQFN